MQHKPVGDLCYPRAKATESIEHDWLDSAIGILTQ